MARRCLREAAHQMRRLQQPLLIPLSDAVIYDHLAGEHTVGASIRCWRMTPAISWLRL
jgi:hypothetical protein